MRVKPTVSTCRAWRHFQIQTGPTVNNAEEWFGLLPVQFGLRNSYNIQMLLHQDLTSGTEWVNGIIKNWVFINITTDVRTSLLNLTQTVCGFKAQKSCFLSANTHIHIVWEISQSALLATGECTVFKHRTHTQRWQHTATHYLHKFDWTSVAFVHPKQPLYGTVATVQKLAVSTQQSASVGVEPEWQTPILFPLCTFSEANS